MNSSRVRGCREVCGTGATTCPRCPLSSRRRGLAAHPAGCASLRSSGPWRRRSSARSSTAVQSLIGGMLRRCEVLRCARTSHHSDRGWRCPARQGCSLRSHPSGTPTAPLTRFVELEGRQRGEALEVEHGANLVSLLTPWSSPDRIMVMVSALAGTYRRGAVVTSTPARPGGCQAERHRPAGRATGTRSTRRVLARPDGDHPRSGIHHSVTPTTYCGGHHVIEVASAPAGKR